jgi:hypothetical protein
MSMITKVVKEIESGQKDIVLTQMEMSGLKNLIRGVTKRVVDKHLEEKDAEPTDEDNTDE